MLFSLNCLNKSFTVWCHVLLQFRRNEQEAPSSHAGGPPGTTIGGGGNVRSRFRLREPNHRQDQNQIASAIQASLDSANAEAAHRDARQHALAQVCLAVHCVHQLTALASLCIPLHAIHRIDISLGGK